MSVTMRQVAKQAGCSLKTVSRVVNEEESVSQETREKVQQVIDQLKFVPNLAARRLSSGNAMALGVVLGWSIDAPYSSSLIRHVLSVCRKNGYGLNLFSDDENATKQVSHAFLGKQVDGILLDTKSGLNKNLIEQLDALSVPYVIINPSRMDGVCVSSYVTIDDYISSKKGVEYLIDLGHRSIGCIIEKTDHSQERDRLRGYRDALAGRGIPFQQSWVADNDRSTSGLEMGFANVSHLITNNKDLTAIFCGTDDIAFGTMSAIWQSGLKIPDDISVLGFDDSRYSSIITPPLTTIRQPIDRIADVAVTQLLKMINDPTTERIEIVLPTSIVVRKSCRALI